jgi:diacylglycerol O-acyltransferase
MAMANVLNGDRLSWGDALFLYLEREGMPMNIASVSTFEGKIALADCIRSIEAKLPLLPRYSQRILTPPLNIGFPSWEDDPDFDIHNHIREVRLKRGTEAELKLLSAKMLSSGMDRRHPLWDLTLVQGLKGDRTAMLLRIHHCLADGIAGLGLMSTLMDPGPDTPRIQPRNGRKHRRARLDPLGQLLDGWISSYSHVLDRALSAQADLLNISESFLAPSGWPSKQFARLLPELAAPTKRLFFNITYQGPQRFAWAKVPISDIKQIRAKCDATHNDVVLALITLTIGRYAELHGDKLKGRLLRMMVPVNVRGTAATGELGNCISLLPVTVPLDIRSPRKLLAAVHERTEFLKRAHVAEWVGLVGGLVGTAPAALQAMVGPIASLLPITPFNMVCTNLRGPDTPFTLLGHKMLEWYPYVPVGGEMAMNCAILSYNGVTYFGFSGDVHAAPDLTRLETLLMESLAELQRASGIRPPTNSTTAKSKPKPLSRRNVANQPAMPVSKPVVTTNKVQQPAAVQSPAPAPEPERIMAMVAAD